jgi:hypothetical protein
MPSIGAKQPRYGPRLLSGWERFQAWRNARKSAVTHFMSEGATASASLTAALNNQIAGEAKLAAQAAIKRIGNEAAGKVAKAQSVLDKLV